MQYHRIFVWICLIALWGCSQDSKPNQATLFTLMESDATGITFQNQVKDTEDFNIFTYRNFYNGGGVAIGDINNDGWADIYFTANTSGNKLYLNKGNWSFEDITEKAGVLSTKSWSTGVTMVDVNADGWLDIYVCNSGDVKGGNRENELFINNGNLTFTESARKWGLNDEGFSTHASFFDYDLDGDLDCYLLNNSFKTIDRVEQFYITRDVRDEDGGDKLFRNDNGIFVNVSEKSGIYSSEIGFGLGVSVSDLNGDMLPDMYISNDFWERDYLYINNGDGTFSEDIIKRTGVVSASSMGSDVADLDNDGDLEIFTTEMLPADNVRLKTMARFEETNIQELKVRSSYHYQQMQNCLQWNYGDGNFQELASLLGVDDTDWSWGCLMFDMNNDGRKDIFVSNGIYRDITSMDFTDFVADRENIKKIVSEQGKFDFEDLLALIPSTPLSNYGFINNGNKQFSNATEKLGLSKPSFSNGSAYGDLDNDGDLDLVVNNLNMPSFVYKNNSNKNYLKVAFNGPKGNPFGIGARVTLYTNGTKQVQQNFMTRGFESSIEPQLLFGLDSLVQVDSLEVIWPDFKKQIIGPIKVNQQVRIKYLEADKTFVAKETRSKPQFVDVTDQVLKGNHLHVENPFNDFDHERLQPRKISAEGPKIVIGDVNMDGLEDFVLLGAAGDNDKLFLQTAAGQFVEKTSTSLSFDQKFESTCGVFFDPDLDGDMDLLLGSGGNEPGKPKELYQLRFYENNLGRLTRKESLLTVINGNFSCILAEDFDKDGDEDLFLGRRVVPGNYGVNPGSFLIRNDGGGQWTTITTKSLASSGMVTDAVWCDLDGDSLKDLVVTADWKPVMIHKNVGNTLAEGQPIPNSEGWWMAVEIGDFNGDKKNDLVLGNWGINSRFSASLERPMEMFVNDFDQNGKTEFVITMYPTLEDKAYPFATKMDLTSQLPMLKKRALKYRDYATMGYEDLFTSVQRQGAQKYKVVTLRSALLLNQGNGKFELKALPPEAQVAPVFSILVYDLDGDHFDDLILSGNFSGLKHEIARQDANRTVLLKNDGKAGFSYISPEFSGVFVQGEVRDLKLIKAKDSSKERLLIGRNNNTMLIYEKKLSN